MLPDVTSLVGMPVLYNLCFKVFLEFLLRLVDVRVSTL